MPGFPLYQKVKKLFDTVSYYTLSSIQKIKVKREPECLTRQLTLDSRNGRIKIPNQMVSITSRRFCYRDAAKWNQLPHQLKR